MKDSNFFYTIIPAVNYITVSKHAGESLLR